MITYNLTSPQIASYLGRHEVVLGGSQGCIKLSSPPPPGGIESSCWGRNQVGNKGRGREEWKGEERREGGMKKGRGGEAKREGEGNKGREGGRKREGEGRRGEIYNTERYAQ